MFASATIRFAIPLQTGLSLTGLPLSGLGIFLSLTGLLLRPART